MRTSYGSVCSGIEAASVAWKPLGWRPAWFSEIEPFPSAVLAHHWPDVPNLGDMLTLPALVDAGAIEAPDILVGGTPCQAFSVAGNRESLADARGGLTLAFVELADAIDRCREIPCTIVWENVPGVLSTRDNAFGCFLAGLAGEDEPLLPPGKRWTNAGLVLGPKRAVAWRILDAQYFGLAQRRRRVFVIASARDGFDPGAVLFESEGVRRDTPPRRETGKDAARHAGPGAAYHDVALCLNAGGMGRIDYETESMVVNTAIPILEPGARTGKSTTDVRAGLGVGEAGDPMYTLQAGKHHGVAFAQEPVPYDLFQITAPVNRQNRKPGDPCHTLARDNATHASVCVSVTGDITHTLNTANNGKGCSEDGTGRGVPPAVCGPALAVRRLTPTECERLQGFHDGHTAVPYRGKPAADGPRYKAIGNSMAVPVMRWIGARLARAA